jgi:hypothetical protein
MQGSRFRSRRRWRDADACRWPTARSRRDGLSRELRRNHPLDQRRVVVPDIAELGPDQMRRHQLGRQGAE